MVVTVLDGDAEHDVFELVGVSDGIIRARSAFQFEVGEELELRLTDGDKVTSQKARVRGHVGPADARITELVLVDAG